MNSPQPTPEQNARDIAALTSALEMVVTQFVRPSVQQANANREALDQAVSRFTEGLLTLEARLDQITTSLEGVRDLVAQNTQQLATIAQQQQANAQQIAQNTEAVTEYRRLLEETRQLVAKNSSDIAQATTEMKARGDEQQARLDQLIEENKAFRESQQTQLAAIIGNARRIDRLEQQAS